MEVYYTKKEFKDMKKSLEKKIQLLTKQNQVLTEKVKKLQKKDVAD
jgi:chaperonin cofactor prefoldin